MVLDNKLGLTSVAELAREEEKLTKKRAKELFETGKLFQFEVGTYQGLAGIHAYLFEDIYDFAGKMREANIAKNDFQFAPRIFLEQSLTYIDQLPHTTFDQIVDKYADMNVAHPFREGNGRSMRLWLDCMFHHQLGKVVDWNSIDKEEYLNAMMRSHVATGELKYLLQNHLTEDVSDSSFFKGIDASYYYEGYTLYRTEDL
ncbi:protein adenylyltransferase Fic [Rothia aerolata]|uniref:protein adenylyltransferase n=1 Tax=Rothia aerolata TaxID=1812262 RepID=A0A917IUN6_9MICC|nr:Fic family protein [Rothia aerolata]GGH63647.1 cell filamentation protein [Rothia aerolata]